jgi:hypothetical protein
MKKILAILVSTTFGFSASANAQTPFGDLNNMMKNVQNIVEGKTDNAAAPPMQQPTPSNRNTIPSSATATPSQKQAASPSPASGSSSSDYCNRVQSNPDVERYVDAMVNVGRINKKDWDYFPLGNEMLREWVGEKMTLSFKDYMSSDHANKRRVMMYATINECAYSLQSTKYILLFSNSIHDKSELDRQIERRFNKNTRSQKKLDASGNLVEVAAAPTSIDWKNSSNWFVPYDNYNLTSVAKKDIPAAAYALYFDGGDKAIANTAPPIIAAIQRAVENKASKKLAEEKAEEKRKKDAAEAQAKSIEDHAKSIAAIKSNPATAKSCADFAEAKGYDPRNSNPALLPSISPDNKIYAIEGVLAEYSEGNMLSGSKGTIYTFGDARKRVGKNYASITIGKNTVWVDKEIVAVGKSIVFGYGKYVSNTKFNLTNGSTVPGPVFEMQCIQGTRIVE